MTHLTNLVTVDGKPDVVRLVLLADIFTKSRISLDPTRLTLLADAFYSGAFLTRDVLPDILFETLVRTRIVDRRTFLVCPDRKECERLNVGSVGRKAFGCPWHVRFTGWFLVRPEHPETASAIDARVDKFRPFRTVEFHENFRPVGERLLSRHERVRPVNMDAGLLEAVHLSNRSARHDTSTRDDVAHLLEHLEQELIRDRLRTLVIEVDKESKDVRLLFNHINLSASPDSRNVLDVECIRVRQWNVKNSTIHEHMRSGSVERPPFFKHI